jgi:O-antigen/teichoic acid export membrane protein
MSSVTKRIHKKTNREKGTSLATSIIFGLLSALLAGLALLLLFTFFLYKKSDPALLSGILSLSALYPACVFGGFIAAQKSSSDHFFTASLVCAASMSCISIAINIINNSPFKLITSVPYYLGIFAAFLVGAYIKKKLSSSHRHRRKR